LADGDPPELRDDAAEQAALAEEARLVRRVRWRLVAWSGISTLVVLVVLGAALYAAVGNSLAAASLQQLENRARPLVTLLQGPTGDPGQRPEQGFVLGGGNTLLFIFDADGNPVQPGDRPVAVPEGLPESAGLAAARTSTDAQDVRTAILQLPGLPPQGRNPGSRCGAPRGRGAPDGNTYSPVLQDRSTEVATLDCRWPCCSSVG
jgi:hypothetical protein